MSNRVPQGKLVAERGAIQILELTEVGSCRSCHSVLEPGEWVMRYQDGEYVPDFCEECCWLVDVMHFARSLRGLGPTAQQAANALRDLNSKLIKLQDGEGDDDHSA